MHSFTAFEDPNEYQTPADLRAAAENDCESVDYDGGSHSSGYVPDRSSYWVPALYSTNLSTVEWVAPSVALVYYASAGVDPNDVRAFPQDFTWRAGDPTADLNNPRPQSIVKWSCVASAPPGIPNEVNFGSTIPHTCPKYLTFETEEGPVQRPYKLRLEVSFPNCVNLDTGVHDPISGQWHPDDEGWAYSVDNPDPEATYPEYCADEDMTPVPRVKIGYRWALSAAIGIPTYLADPAEWDLTSLKVASDMSNMQNDGVFAHADFMSGWSTTDLQNLLDNCYWDHNHGGTIGAPRNCGFIHDYAEERDD